MSSGYKQGDIVWVDFPFPNDPTKSKKRPAVIISNSDCHKNDNDIILAAITKTIRATRFSFFLDSSVVLQSMPEKDCEVRCNKLFTTTKDQLKGKISEINPSNIKDLLDMVHSAIKLI